MNRNKLYACLVDGKLPPPQSHITVFDFISQFDLEPYHFMFKFERIFTFFHEQINLFIY